MTDFRQTGLWQSTLKARDNDSYAPTRERLRAAYEIFWSRGVELAQRISADLPGLTLHDERHLAALWERASQLTGDNYSINPLEAFVFGGAVLLHDTGHALSAYQGGLAELKHTAEYRDAVAAILRKRGANPASKHDINNPDQDVAHAALFATLRRLHAGQAMALPTRTFEGMYLIDDQELRDNLGQLIGRIAASHQWDRNILDEKLSPKKGAPGSMPHEWSIQPLKIAYLLRCADAIQIDQKRAPAFPAALHGPKGVSAQHWQAQQLAQPFVVPNEKGGAGELTFTSQTAFTEENADAWWVAHDLIRIANEELQGCYQLMKDGGIPTFTVDRISGAENPRQLERYVEADGWRPISAEVRVSSVDQIIRLFGGALLYGYDPAVPLREVIQNACDAVRARRGLNVDSHYEGGVFVSLKETNIKDSWELIVEDDGIGMSEHVLTGPLIEFGKSFWTSEEVQDEFPGLLSTNLHQTGRYGIGFFSSLLVAQRIEVTSRRWDQAQDQARKLTFRDGLQLRPLVSKKIGASLGRFSTRIVLTISQEKVEELFTLVRPRQDKLKITLRELVSHLCPCIDCDVRTRQSPGEWEIAHSREWPETDARTWARQITFAEQRPDRIFDEYFEKVAPLIRLVGGSNGETLGRAAIAFGQFETGVDSVGGLVSAHHSRAINNFSMSYIGAVEFEPSGPRRDSGALRDRSAVEAWATEQAELLSKITLSDLERYLAAINVAQFGGDPTPVAMILINRKPTTLAKVYEILAEGKEIFAALAPLANGPAISLVHYRKNPYIGVGLAWDELDFSVVALEAWSGRQSNDRSYHVVPTVEEPCPSCFLSCLERYAKTNGRALKLEIVHDLLFAIYKGEESAREKLVTGAELRENAIRLWLE